jgi:hypothetical protein
LVPALKVHQQWLRHVENLFRPMLIAELDKVYGHGPLIDTYREPSFNQESHGGV